MQLVGATRGFIRKPFLIQSAFQGLVAGLIAIGLLMSLLYLIEREFFKMFSYQSVNLLILLGVSIITTGVIINIVSTFFSVNRYLNISEDKLYY
jgi:cell division transport system permease protein